MENQTGIGRRELFRKLAKSAGAAGVAAAIPGAAALAESAESTPGASAPATATVRVILADGTSVQWLAVTNGGMTVGGRSTISAAAPGLNASIVTAAIAAIVAAGGPQLTWRQVTLLGGKV